MTTYDELTPDALALMVDYSELDIVQICADQGARLAAVRALHVHNANSATCEHCSESERIHLGKTSAGWQLLFQADSDWAPDQVMAEWMKLAESGPIEDEYGRPCTLPEFLAMAASRRDLRSHLEPQPDLGPVRYPPEPGYYITVGDYEFCTRYFS